MIELRVAASEADRAASLALWNAALPRQAFAPEEIDRWERIVSDSVDLLVTVNGKPAGSGVAAVRPWSPNVVFAIVAVLPAFRSRGVGTATYRELSRWAEARGHDRLESHVEDDDPASLAFATRRDFEQSSHEGGLALDLRAAPPLDVDPPPGVEIVSLAERPELAPALYDVALEALPDVPGTDDWRPVPREDWVAGFGGAGRPDAATAIALADGRVVGYAKLRVSPARPGIGLHDMTGVLRAWRRRGIAGALKRAQIAWARGAGLDVLETTNELRNEPMRRVNERLGYRPAPGLIVLLGPLSGATT